MEAFFSKEVEDFLHNLVAACGIAGNTQEVEAVIEQRLKMPHIHLEKEDAGLGQVIGVVNPGQSFRVLLGAHMDVVGFRVSHIDHNGFIYFRSVGGIDNLSIKGRTVMIWTRKGPIRGLIQHTPIHHMEEEQRKKIPDSDDFWIRTEFVGEKNPSMPIEIGNPITFDGVIKSIGPNLFAGPGLDDRVGVLVMTELMRRFNETNLKISLHAVATSGEEIGCRGIRALTQKIAPQLAIALDVTAATDYPTANLKRFGVQMMGKGPLIAVGYNTRTIYNENLIETAREHNIPYQLRAEDITPTDGREMDEAGVPTIVVRLPGNMLHTGNDLIDRRDIEWTAQLLFHFLQRLPL